MPINLRTTSLALVLSGIVSFPVFAVEQADQPADFLLRGAKMWVDRDRADVARKLLKKLILMEPNSQEALFLMGKIALKEGKSDEARHYLRSLEKTAPDGKLTLELKEAIEGKPTPKRAPEIKTAQAEPEESVQTKPAAKPAEKPAAKKAEAKHSKRHKAEKKPAEEKPQTPEAQAGAGESELAEDPDIVARTAALDAIDDGNYQFAETTLLDVLKRRPTDPEVVGGIGMVKLKEGKTEEAENWFKQALSVSDEGGIGKWTSLVATAGYWKNIHAAGKLLDEGKLAEAETTIQQAIALKDEHPDALALLGDIKAAGNQTAEAEQIYREVLKTEPYNSSAISGLATLLAKSQRSEEALQLVEQALKNYSEELGRSPGGHASILRVEAELYIEANRPSYAIKALETAVKVDPKNAWIRFSLAKLYIKLKLVPLARLVMQEGIALSPDDPVMHYTHALIMISLDDYAAALNTLNQVPEASLTSDMRDAKNLAQIHYYFQQADEKFAKGQRKEAIRILSIAQTQAEGNYSATEQVAEGWFRLGQQKLGLDAMRKLPQPVPLKTQVYYASLLNRAGKDQELTELLPELHVPEGPDENYKKYRDTIHDIEFAMAGRQYDKLIKAKKKEQAQEFADSVLNANQLSSADYFKYHRRYFSSAQLPDNAIDALSQEVEQNPNDLEMRWELAYALYQNKQKSSAQRELTQLIALTKPDDIDMRLRIAKLQQNLGDSSGANETLDDLAERFPDNTEVTLQAGHIARYQGKYNRAMDYYEQTLERSGKTASTDEKPAEKPAQPELLLNLLPAKSSAGRAVNIAPAMAGNAESERIYRVAVASDARQQKTVSNTDAASAQEEMDLIKARRIVTIETGLDLQRKSSTSGLSTYNATEIPLMAHFPLGYEAYGTVQVDKVSVDAGTLATADSTSFGTGAPLPAMPQKASGTSFGVGFENDMIKADIGMVGEGFPVRNVVGGLHHGGSIGRMSYSLNLARRPYTGSLISYAGTRDPVSGMTWGGVTNTGLSLYMSTTLSTSAIGDVNVSGMASYGLLRGTNVLDNDRLYLHAGVDQDVYSTEDMVLNVGLGATFMSFSKNLSGYTLGQGGYYSPQSSISIGVPIELIGRSDALSFQIRTNISYSNTQTDPSPYFPTPQALAAAAAAGAVTTQQYQGGPGKGFGYGFRAAAEYRVAPEIALGGRFNMDRSAYYAPNSLLFYLRYIFNPEKGPVKLRPEAITPYSQY